MVLPHPNPQPTPKSLSAPRRIRTSILFRYHNGHPGVGSTHEHAGRGPVASHPLRKFKLTHDPFDRMLIAQARTEGLTLATADQALRRYDVPILG